MNENDFCCQDWKANIGYLQTPFMLNLTAIGTYRGKSFEFCPWCGKPLNQKVAALCSCGVPHNSYANTDNRLRCAECLGVVPEQD